MKTKKIVLAFITVTLIALLVFLSIPHNLNNTLHFSDSEWVSISIQVSRIVSGQEGSQSVSEAESFTFQRGTDGFCTRLITQWVASQPHHQQNPIPQRFHVRIWRELACHAQVVRTTLM